MKQPPDGAAASTPGGTRIFGSEPMLVRQWEATRFLWGTRNPGRYRT
jgi:hypothetical protein